jgi:hypothetical protein
VPLVLEDRTVMSLQDWAELVLSFAQVLHVAMTCTAIMVSASHWVGLTFSGMIDEPGSFSGIASPANPARGPHDISRISLAILYSDTANVRRVPDSWTSASWAPWTVNLLGAVTNGRPVRRAITSPGC